MNFFKYLFLVLIVNNFSFGLTDIEQNEIIALGKKYLGGKYVWGGNTPSGFDCSGYTKYIFSKKGINLPRTALQQSKVGHTVKTEFKKGDLLFFNTDKSRGIPVSHVGVYLENGKFIHAASKDKGIIISSFSSYKKYFVTAKRILDSKNINFDNSFFAIFEKAVNSPTNIKLEYQEYIIVDGRYKLKDNR